MRIIELKNLFVCFALFSTCFLLPLNSHAITILPATKIIETESEKPETFSIKIYNESIEKNLIYVYVSDFDVDKNNNKIFKPIGSTRNSISKYLKIVEPSSFFIEPKENKEVFFNLTVPKNILGGNKSMVFFQSKLADDNTLNKNSKKMIMSIRAGATILQESKGSTNIKSTISKIDVIKPLGSQNLVIKIKIKNDGNTFINTSGTISLVRDDDSYISSTSLEEKIIYQNMESTVNGNFTSIRSLEPGSYHALITYKYRDKTISIDKAFKIE